MPSSQMPELASLPQGATSNQPVPSITASTRVCDRCMVKKIKCNLKRPACSRCLEENSSCVYSSLKRKPGPSKGTRRKRSVQTSTAIIRSIDEATQGLPEVSPQNAGFQFEISNMFADPTFNNSMIIAAGTSLTSTDTSSSLNQGSRYDCLPDPQLQADQELQLLDNFFTYVQPSMPLFHKDTFMQSYRDGLVRQDLLLTVLAVSAKVQGPASTWTHCDPNSCLDYLLTVKFLEDNAIISLDNYQQACLLAFYQFHQYPGQKSWLRISQLTRAAYQCGLHQIDNEAFSSSMDFRAMKSHEVEAWRCVWWCIYCLDSYCNITAATPFVIELESVRTALPNTSSSEDGISSKAVFLPSDTEDLWETSKEVTSRRDKANLNMHIISTTVLRESGRLSRLWKQNPSNRLRTRITLHEDHMAAIRLALPIRYLTVTRDVLSNETECNHHSRLICILHLHAARLLISLPIHLNCKEAEWSHRWQQTLEYTEDIVSVVKQWKPQLSLSVDPAICFIISAALSLLHIHSKYVANTVIEVQTRLKTSQNLLMLFLEQFASIWHLSRFLIVSYHKFSEKYAEPMTATEIDQILLRMQGPLYQSWFKFLELQPEHVSLSVQQNVDIFSPFPEVDTSYNDWESWLDASNTSYLPQAS